tara:strand:- start:530 stop:1210 length:681 start_codon:yes stop_codon:yes gene_type:complete
MMNAPVLEEKGELNLGVSAGNGTDVTASYAITDYLAVSSRFTSNLNLDFEVTFDSSQSFTAKNHNYEVALGYFNANNESYNLSLFAGYAMGKTGAINNDFFVSSVSSDEFGIGADFTSFFIQGAAFANIDEENHIGLVARVNALEYSNFRYSDIFTNNTQPIIFKDKTKTVGQVGIQYNYKGQKFGVLGQVQYAFTDSNNDYFTVRSLGIHVGAYLRLNEIFKKVN